MTGRTRSSGRRSATPGPSNAGQSQTQQSTSTPGIGAKRRASSTRGNKSKRARTTATASKRSKSRKGRGRATSDDEDDSGDSDNEDNNNDDDDNGKKTNKKKLQKGQVVDTELADQRAAVKTEQGINDLTCDFCKSNPPDLDDDTGCNREVRDGYVFECQRCADHRFLSGDPDHVCVRTGQDDHLEVFKSYSTGHPLDFPTPVSCEECQGSSRCDADPFLQLKCTACMKTKSRVPVVCNVKATTTDMGWGLHAVRRMGQKPNLQKGKLKWFRRECDICRNLPNKRNASVCSWLDTRDTSQPCQQCAGGRMSCMTGGMLVGNHPNPLEMPTKWTTTGELGGGWLDLRGESNIFRTQCKQCSLQKRHCRASAKYAEYACNWCWQTGMVCRDKDNPNTIYPLFDLSRVGIGNFCPFAKCSRCEAKGRNCDRQRPCDSCFYNGEADKCDTWQVGAERTLNCLDRRINEDDEQPGPLYYLSLGYGADGVNDEKDGTQIEHYIGPPFARYAFRPEKDDVLEFSRQTKQSIVAGVQTMRKALVASGVPPLGAPGCELAGLNVNDITVKQLRDWMTVRWPNWIQQCNKPDYLTHKADEMPSRPYREHLEGRSTTRTRRQSNRVVELNDDDEEDEDEDEDEDAEGEKEGPDDEVEEENDRNNTGGRGDGFHGQNRRSSNASARQSSLPFVTGSNAGQSNRLDMAPPTAGGSSAYAYGGGGLANDNVENMGNMMRYSGYQTRHPANGSAAMEQTPRQTHTLVNLTNTTSGVIHPSQLMSHPQPQPQPQQQTMGFPPYPYNNGDGVLPSFTFVPPSLFIPQFWPPSPSFPVGGTVIQYQATRWRQNNMYAPNVFELAARDREMADYVENLALSTSSGINIGLFSVVNGSLLRQTPIVPVLSRIPSQVISHPGIGGNQCLDRTAICNESLGVAICQGTHAHGTSEIVCSPCEQDNRNLLVTGPDQITRRDLISMRAYFCTPCHGRLTGSPQTLGAMHKLGVSQVWGCQFTGGANISGALSINGRQLTLNESTHPVTGCLCGEKIFRSYMCRDDRFHFARLALYQASRVNGWREAQGEAGLCPGCLMQVPVAEAGHSPSNSELAHVPADSQETVSWACLVCGDLVLNQPKKHPEVGGGWLKWFTTRVSDWGPDSSMLVDPSL